MTEIEGSDPVSGSNECANASLTAASAGFESEKGHPENHEREGDDSQAAVKPSVRDDEARYAKKKYRDRNRCRALENWFVQEEPAAKPSGQKE